MRFKRHVTFGAKIHEHDTVHRKVLFLITQQKFLSICQLLKCRQRRAGLANYLCCPNILTVYHEKRTKMISELKKVSPKKQYRLLFRLCTKFCDPAMFITTLLKEPEQSGKSRIAEKKTFQTRTFNSYFKRQVD